MTSHQLSELTPQELYVHTDNIVTEAFEAMRRANMTVMRGPIEVPRRQDPPTPDPEGRGVGNCCEERRAEGVRDEVASESGVI
jgi:hypothetical protein